MRKGFALLMISVLVSVSVFNGCTEKENAAAPQTSAVQTKAAETAVPEMVAAETSPAETETAETPEIFLFSNEKPYADILDKYARAVTEGWNFEQYAEEDMCCLFRDCKSTDEIGFCLEYFDDGAFPYLLLGRIGDEYSEKQIYDMYTIENGALKHLFCAGERDSYFYMPHDETASVWIAEQGSASAFMTGWYYYGVYDNSLHCLQGILYDSEHDPDCPWFFMETADWDYHNGSGMTEEQAMSFIDSYEKMYRKPDYRPLSDGFGRMSDDNIIFFNVYTEENVQREGDSFRLTGMDYDGKEQTVVIDRATKVMFSVSEGDFNIRRESSDAVDWLQRIADDEYDTVMGSYQLKMTGDHVDAVLFLGWWD